MNIAFIPVRGGSKSIPLKNIKVINGRPLVYWTVLAACKCKDIDKVYIATDSGDIRRAVDSFCKESPVFDKVRVVDRSAETASDTASTESAMLEFAENNEFDTMTLIQATSPLLSYKDLERGFEIFRGEGTDSVLSVVPQKRFIWKENADGIAYPDNYDVFNRPRRQDFEAYYVENGAFYITSREDLLKSSNRVSGNIKVCPMCEESFIEIDEPSDWVIVESIMENMNIKPENAPAIPGDIRLFLTDCDGCLTDGGMYYTENGDEIKKFNAIDGMGLRLLREAGIRTGMVTGEKRELNLRRATKVKMDFYIDGCQDKVAAVKQLCEENAIDLSQIAYIGDDINDYEIMKLVGISACPASAQKKIKEVAGIVLSKNGGQGAVREFAELILEKKNAD